MKPISAASKRAIYYRGSPLMWTKDTVDFRYKNDRVLSSQAYQQAGWVFPNIARNKGIIRYSRTGMRHSYRASNEIGAGIPTPWGDIKLYSSSSIHKIHVYGNGFWKGYKDS